MFKYQETYIMNCYHYYDEKELKILANMYNNFINNYYIYHNIKKENNINSFCDFIGEMGIFDKNFNDNSYYDFDNSNIDEFYNEIKKYM